MKKLKYHDREIILHPYPGKIERDLISLHPTGESNNLASDLIDYLLILNPYIQCNINIENLYTSELIFILYSLRAISVSDTINQQIECPKCRNDFRLKTSITNFADFKDLNIPGIKNEYHEDIEKYFDSEKLKDLDISEYDEFEAYIIENRTNFNFIQHIKCPNCQTELSIDFADPNKLARCFSEYDLLNFYKSLTRLSYSGRVSMSALLNDIYPYEREIFSEMINQEIQEINKAKKSGIR